MCHSTAVGAPLWICVRVYSLSLLFSRDVHRTVELFDPQLWFGSWSLACMSSSALRQLMFLLLLDDYSPVGVTGGVAGLVADSPAHAQVVLVYMVYQSQA